MNRPNILYRTIPMLLLLGACSSPPPPEPAPPPQPTAQPTATPSEPKKPEPKPEPPKPKSKAPVLPSMEVQVRPELPKVFEGTLKLFKDKYYSEIESELGKVRELAKKGQLPLDQQMVMYALEGHAHDMSDRPKEAASSYRKILPLWSNPLGAATKVRKLEKDEAAGNKRVAVAVDAMGEALFYLADQKRLKVDKLVFPSFEGGPTPKETDGYLKKLKDWVQRRTQAIKSADKAYGIVEKLKPEPPARWVVAAASRRGAMQAQMFEELRQVKPPAEWSAKGDSPYKNPAGGNKPWTYEALGQRFAQKLDELRKPIEEAAVGAYKACKSAAEQHQVKDPFAQSCSDWLEANGH